MKRTLTLIAALLLAPLFALPFRFANGGQDRDRAGWLTLGRIVIP